MSIKVVIFDLDGTLTVPTLDFDLIRTEMGISEGPVLEAMEQMSPEERKIADAILHQHELVAANNYQINEGVKEVFDFINENNIKTALLTRNQLMMVNLLQDKYNFLQFHEIITREDDGPAKPHPYPILKICESLNISTDQAIMVGDFHFDLLTGKNAGAKTVLITTAKDWQTYAHDADFVIDDMHQLIPIIQNMM